MKPALLFKLFKGLGPAMLIAGGALLYFGYQAQQSASSRIGELFSGTPSDKAMALLIGGGVLLVLGLGATFKGFKGVKP